MATHLGYLETHPFESSTSQGMCTKLSAGSQVLDLYILSEPLDTYAPN